MTTVAELMTAREAEVTAFAAQATSFLAQLQAVTNVVFSDGFNIDGILPNAYNYASVPQVFFPIFNATGNVGSVSNAQPPAAPAASLSSVSTIAVPEFLSSDLLAPTTEFQFYEGVYESILLDPLKAKLLDNLTNGGYGIETADEVALFNRARDREVETALTRIDDAGRIMAARGFPLPPGELSIMVDRAYQDMQNKVSSASRDIMLERDKLYVENRQFTIRESRELEQVLLGFHNSVQERAFNVSRATVELAVALYNTLLARFKVRLDAAKVSSDVQFQTLQVQAEQAKTYFDGFRATVLGYEANVKREVESARIQREIYSANIDNMRVLNDGSIARAGLQQKVLEATVQQNIQISNLAIENAKAKLLATVEALRFKTAAVQYGSEKFFALLTAMEGSINTLATQGVVE